MWGVSCGCKDGFGKYRVRRWFMSKRKRAEKGSSHHPFWACLVVRVCAQLLGDETAKELRESRNPELAKMAFRWRSEGAGVAVGSITERSLSMRGRAAAQRWPLSCSLGEGKWVPTGCGGFAAAGTRFAAGKGGLIVRTMRSIW